MIHMVLNKKEWAHEDKIRTLEGKEKLREKNRRYYNKNTEKVKERVKKNYKTIRAQIIMSLGLGCKFCGEQNPDLLNFHHTIPMLVKESKIYHYKKNIDILCLLCVKCHVEWHSVMDELGIDDIFKEEL